MSSLWSNGFESYLRKFLEGYKCHLCGGDLYFFNGAAYNNPSLEAIYRCKKCDKVNYLMLTDCNRCTDKRAIPIEEIFEIDEELTEEYLGKVSDIVEPDTHCCECTREERHMIHIQYPDCACKKEKYILNKNY